MIIASIKNFVPWDLNLELAHDEVESVLDVGIVCQGTPTIVLLVLKVLIESTYVFSLWFFEHP